MRTAMATRAQAYHEAGHAVARHAVGLKTGSIRCHADGGGWTEGTGEIVIHATIDDSFGYLVQILAGIWAEARATHRGRASIMLAGGMEDIAEAEAFIAKMVSHGHAIDERAAWARAEDETGRLVATAWPAIDRVARALLDRGRLSAAEVDALIAAGPTRGRSP